jgi:PPOX class probable F420-dependent enzyme
MDADAARARFALSRVARLATASADARPHLVPIVFALAGDVLYTAVDGKPKTTTALRRLANMAANPQVAVLVDHYEDDWTRLWWARADGTVRILALDVAEAVAVDRGRDRARARRNRPLRQLRRVGQHRDGLATRRRLGVVTREVVDGVAA